MNKRLKALEAKSAREGLVLTEAQVVALEKAKTEKEAHGEFESEQRRPGYVLCRQSEGCWTYLPTDLHRYLPQGKLCQALRPQNADHGGRSAQ